MTIVADLERSEVLLWTILGRFESLAAQQYSHCAPELVTPEKQAVVTLLQSRRSAGDELAGTRLAAPLATLMTSVTSASESRVLIAQGLFLELIGDAIYRSFGANPATSAPTRDLCASGAAASARARELVPPLLVKRIGRGDLLLAAIVTEASPLLRSLDDLGEGIDASFLDRYGVSFADLMGDVAAELIATCIDLDVDRRTFVAFLTSALMGM